MALRRLRKGKKYVAVGSSYKTATASGGPCCECACDPRCNDGPIFDDPPNVAFSYDTVDPTVICDPPFTQSGLVAHLPGLAPPLVDPFLNFYLPSPPPPTDTLGNPVYFYPSTFTQHLELSLVCDAIMPFLTTARSFSYANRLATLPADILSEGTGGVNVPSTLNFTGSHAPFNTQDYGIAPCPWQFGPFGFYELPGLPGWNFRGETSWHEEVVGVPDGYTYSVGAALDVDTATYGDHDDITISFTGPAFARLSVLLDVCRACVGIIVPVCRPDGSLGTIPVNGFTSVVANIVVEFFAGMKVDSAFYARTIQRLPTLVGSVHLRQQSYWTNNFGTCPPCEDYVDLNQAWWVKTCQRNRALSVPLLFLGAGLGAALTPGNYDPAWNCPYDPARHSMTIG